MFLFNHIEMKLLSFTFSFLLLTINLMGQTDKVLVKTIVDKLIESSDPNNEFKDL